MVVIVRIEPNGKKFMEGYPQVKQILQQAQWLEFIKILDDYDKEVTKYFLKHLMEWTQKLGILISW